MDKTPKIVIIASILAAFGLILGLMVAVLHAIGGNWGYLVTYGVVVGICSYPTYIAFRELSKALEKS